MKYPAEWSRSTRNLETQKGELCSSIGMTYVVLKHLWVPMTLYRLQWHCLCPLGQVRSEHESWRCQHTRQRIAYKTGEVLSSTTSSAASHISSFVSSVFQSIANLNLHFIPSHIASFIYLINKHFPTPKPTIFIRHVVLLLHHFRRSRCFCCNHPGIGCWGRDSHREENLRYSFGQGLGHMPDCL